MLRILLIDNYDSYTYNLKQLLSVVEGCCVDVIANDELTWEELQSRISSYDAAVISPGPGTPECAEDIGVCLPLLEHCTDLPILGVCLGHQALALVAGGQVVRAPEPIHGRLSELEHTHHPLFAGIPSGVGAGYRVVRYHSLTVDASSLPSALEPIAWTCGGHQVIRTAAASASPSAASPTEHGANDRLIMALANRTRPHYGVQFHPESIGTEHGHRLLSNFRDLALLHKGAKALPAYVSPPSPPTRASLTEVQHPSASGDAIVLDLAATCLPVALGEIEGGAESVFRSVCDVDSETGPREGGTTFWLDSADTERGRFSFLGGKGGALWRRLLFRLRPGGCDVTTLHPDGSSSSSFLPNGALASLDSLLRSYDLSPSAKALSAQLPFDFCGGLVGYLGYELKAETGGSAAHASREPDVALFFTDRFLVLDHQEGHVYCVSIWPQGDTSAREAADAWTHTTAQKLQALLRPRAHGSGHHLHVNGNGNGCHAAPLTPDQARESMARFTLARSTKRYLEDIRECDRALHSGDSYEVCLTNRLERSAASAVSTPHPLRPWPFYRLLRTVNRAPYAAWLDFGGTPDGGPVVCCSSPERFLRCYRDGWLEARPIKGTAPRCLTDPEEDRRAAEALAASEKDRAENLMIVDLLRNDLGRVCESGSVHVPGLMEIESYATVHQMVSTICGVRKASCSPIDCIRAAFPGGSMTGAPKVRTMEIIDRIEGSARGVYSGSIGFFSLNGAFDLNIVIRTAVFHSDAADVSIGAGGAIVVQSDPKAEVEEMLLKARALLRTVALCEGRVGPDQAKDLAKNASFWEQAQCHHDS